MTSRAVLRMAQWGGRDSNSFDCTNRISGKKDKELSGKPRLFDTYTYKTDRQGKRLGAHWHSKEMEVRGPASYTTPTVWSCPGYQHVSICRSLSVVLKGQGSNFVRSCPYLDQSHSSSKAVQM